MFYETKKLFIQCDNPSLSVHGIIGYAIIFVFFMFLPLGPSTGYDMIRLDTPLFQFVSPLCSRIQFPQSINHADVILTSS